VLEQILPPSVAVAEAFGDDPAATLFPEEEAIIALAGPRRRGEFATARACAHAALTRLGEPPAPILRDAQGAPQWPEGLVGSIAHCAGYRAAGVARRRDIAAIGFDAERNEPLPGQVLGQIALARELARIARFATARPAVHWDRLLFCAKESVYKTWFPLTGRWLDFDAAEVSFDISRGTFTARLLVPGLVVTGRPVRVLHGRWLVSRGLVVAAITVPARRLPSAPGRRRTATQSA
jgi:4'-phosphopantetheinyl transferase EntD